MVKKYIKIYNSDEGLETNFWWSRSRSRCWSQTCAGFLGFVLDLMFF